MAHRGERVFVIFEYFGAGKEGPVIEDDETLLGFGTRSGAEEWIEEQHALARRTHVRFRALAVREVRLV